MKFEFEIQKVLGANEVSTTNEFHSLIKFGLQMQKVSDFYEVSGGNEF